MKIGVDVSMLNYVGSGVANYTFNLVRHLLLSDNKNEYRLFYSSLRRPKNFYYLKELQKLGAKVYDWRFPPSLLKLWWGKWHIMPVEWFIGKVDVFYSSDFLRPPLLKGTKGITTVHDLIWKIYPKFHEDFIVKAHTVKLDKTVRYKDIVLVDSLNTKKDLKKYYPEMEEEKIHPIYPAVADHFHQITDKKKIVKTISKYLKQLTRSEIERLDYLLYVGAIEPRKNLQTAIKVFDLLIKKEPYRDFKFLIVGRAGWKNEKIFSLVKTLNLENNVIFVGFVEDADLPVFYSAAKVFVYLSLYEGFGLPPIEAAYCGTPTLLYSNSSLSEIFKKNYPFAEKGEELSSLIKLINYPMDPKKYLNDFSWKRYCEKFIRIIEKAFHESKING